jgi:hypothetical protein
MLKGILITAALALSTLSAAPAVAGHREITVDDVAGFKIGVATYGDVIAKLGKPSSVSVLSNGTRTVAYVGFKTHVKAASFIPIVGLFAGGATGDTSVVSFMFGPDGLLQASSATNADVDCSSSIVSAGCQGGAAIPAPMPSPPPPAAAATPAPAPTIAHPPTPAPPPKASHGPCIRIVTDPSQSSC